MKKFIVLMMLILGLGIFHSFSNQAPGKTATDQTALEHDSVSLAQAMGKQSVASGQSGTDETPNTETPEGNFFLENWAVLVLGVFSFLELVARLTPSQKDNSIVNLLISVFNALVPNLKKGGGSFKLFSK